MATRTPKAAMKTKADDGKAPRAQRRSKKEEPLDFESARAAQALEAEAAKERKADKRAKGKAKPAKGKKGKDKPVEFADEGLIIDTPAPERPGFMARWRASREEKAQARAAEADRRAAERAAEEQRKAEERAAAEEQARKEAEERRVAEEAAAVAAEKERKKEEARAARAAAKEEAARLEAEKEAAAEAKREQRRLERQAARQAIEERERLAAEQAEAEDRRREEERAAKAAAAAARKAEAKELEPDLEFEEGSTPVDPSRAMVPARKEPEKGGKGKPSKSASPAATEADQQAERMAEELARRRSKPVVILEDEAPSPKLPNLREVATGEEADEEPAAPLVTGEPVVDERYKPDAPLPAPPSGLSIPEMFILAVNEGGWDERIEKAKPGRLGAALSGAVVLELLVRGRVLVQRDRFTVVGEPGDDPAVEAAVAKLRSIRERKGDLGSLPHMRRFAKWNREMLEPFKERLAGRGLVRHGHRMHLGVLYRSHVDLLDEDAQERLRNKLRRAIAGGGTPEASSILLLGLLDACGLLALIVPDEAMDYNRKRLNGLLGGRDIMGYKVDPQLKALQEVAVRTILQNVRAMT